MSQDADWVEQNEINHRATVFFDGIRPPDWKKISPSPDDFVDYQLETRENAALTGLTVYVQQKGTKKLAITNKGAKFAELRTKHLKYWVDRCRRPVFLIVIDVTKSEGYWLFIQKYALEILTGSNWRQQQKLTVFLPINQSLHRMDDFKKAMEDADKYMTGMRPAAIEASIKVQKAKLESIDPRFEISITANENGINYALNPRTEPVPISMIFKGSKERGIKLENDLIGRGVPVELKPGEIEFVGSPLFEVDEFKQFKKLHFNISVIQDVHLAAVNQDGTPDAELTFPAATTEGGTAEFRVHCELWNKLVELDGTWVPNKGPHIILRYNFSKWFSLPLFDLPYFEQISRLVKAILQGREFGIYFTRLGKRIYAGTAPQLTKQVRKKWTSVLSVIELIERARTIARRLNFTPKLPQNIKKNDYKMVDDLYNATNYGSWPQSNFSAITDLIHPGPKAIEAANSPDGMASGTVTLAHEPTEIIFWGQAVSVPSHKYILSHMVGRLLPPRQHDGITVEWTATKDTIITLARDDGQTSQFENEK